MKQLILLFALLLTPLAVMAQALPNLPHGFPTPPNTAYVYSGLQQSNGMNVNPGNWHICYGACSGGGTVGYGAFRLNQTAPNGWNGMEEKCTTGNGAAQASNCLFYQHLPCGVTPGGGTTRSASLTLTVPTPTINMGSLVLTAYATDTTYTITAMQVYVDGVLYYDTTSSSSIHLTLSGLSGTHHISVKAWNSNGDNVLYTLSPSPTLSGSCAPNSVTNVLYDVYFYIPSGDNYQGIEFDPDMFTGTDRLFMSMQCAVADGNIWRFWDTGNDRWAQTAGNGSTYSCDLAPGLHELTLYGTFSPTAGSHGQYTYQDMAIDGKTIFKNLGNTYDGLADSTSEHFNVENQIDNVSAGAPAQTNTLYVLRETLVLW